MKICFVLGTRPEIIKLSPIIKECQNRKYDFFIVHTNQHYSENLDKIFFDCLKLPKANYNLNTGSGNHGETTGKMIINIEKILIEEKPDIVLIQGDTNSVLSGGLAAAKLHIPIGHVESGLRSYDKNMPEEVNRIIVDHISDFLFSPTKKSKKNLLKEGIDEDKIFITGNTIVDSLQSHIKIANSTSKILNKLNISPKKFILFTLHRQENVDNKDRLKEIILGVEDVSKILKMPIVTPGHPRLIKMLKEYKITLNKNFIQIPPVDYLDFIIMEKHAKIIITDSGGIQEEAFILETPCFTTRDNTERPETLKNGANYLVGASSKKIVSLVKKNVNNKPKYNNNLGNGKSSKTILNIVKRQLNKV